MKPSFVTFLLGVTLTLSVCLALENGRNINAYRSLAKKMEEIHE